MMKTLIMCNGEPPSPELLSEIASECDVFIGADGGGNNLLNAGIKPDYVTGDMDSFDSSAHPEIELRPDLDQETNDLEKALKLAAELQRKSIIICGATGFRLDHTLKNLSVIQQYKTVFNEISVIDNYMKAFILPEEFEMISDIGTALSLFPLSGRVDGITTEGLKYRLENDFLENGVRDGSSNEVVSENIRITHKSGTLLMMIAR